MFTCACLSSTFTATGVRDLVADSTGNHEGSTNGNKTRPLHRGRPAAAPHRPQARPRAAGGSVSCAAVALAPLRSRHRASGSMSAGNTRLSHCYCPFSWQFKTLQQCWLFACEISMASPPFQNAHQRSCKPHAVRTSDSSVALKSRTAEASTPSSSFLKLYHLGSI